MKISQKSHDTLVIDTRGGVFVTLLFIPLFCGFFWLLWLSLAAAAPFWVLIIVGIFALLTGLIAFQSAERVQVTFDRTTNTAKWRKRQGFSYENFNFALSNVEGFEINPEAEGFTTRPGPMERVCMYLHVSGGMDAGYYLVTSRGKSHYKTRKLIEEAHAWLAGRAP